LIEYVDKIDEVTMIDIKNFSVSGLFGHFSISVSFENNRLVLVGENGTGKSTFILILYYLLSKQWEKLEEIQFYDLKINLNDKLFTISKEEIILSNNFLKRRYINFPSELVSLIEKSIAELNLDMSVAINNIKFHNKIQEHTHSHFPINIYNSIIQSLLAKNKKITSIREYENYLNLNMEQALIFLPTYRRIEKDFEAIFSNNDANDRPIRNINRLHIEKSELVAFGMQDVIRIITSKMSYLNNSFRSGLQGVVSEYLLDVLGDKYNIIDISTLDYEKLKNIDIILDKIGGEILPDQEKRLVKEKIEYLKVNQNPVVEDKIIIDFILKIMALQDQQNELESDVETFVNITNKYLVNKKFVFDRSSYQLLIHNELTSDSVDLNNLSSGEKQVVSIFAHLFLREENQYLLIFDEPELSLSVPWQKTFLEDISISKNCNGVIAVTHSPFIYDNSMEKYCHSITENFKAE
jgi:predicted ATPase